MKSFRLRLFVIAIGLFILNAAFISSAEDYLVIKKRDGGTQKVPLDFAPEQIESFQVEPGTEKSDQAETPTAPPPVGRTQEKTAVPDSSGTPMILKKGPGSPALPSGPKMEPSYPPIMDDSTPAEKPKTAPAPPRSAVEAAPQPTPKISGPIASGPVASKGLLTANVYRLPDNLKALPDFTAFRPVSSLTTDRINFEPAKGDNEPAGITDFDGLGLRVVGLFMVSGEGIFKFRVQSKDGVRLHIDDKTILENDGIHEASSKTGFIHLAEGVHTIILDYFNSKGSPSLRLFVEPPLGGEQLFSASTGLIGWKEPEKPYDVLWGQVYFVPKGNFPEGPDFSQLSPIGRLIAAELNLSGRDTIPGLPGRKDMIGIRYQGFFNVEGAGIFAFRLISDHFARLTIGKQAVAEITSGGKPDPNGKLGWAFLQQGSYPITVDYFHATGQPRLELLVTSPIKDEEIFNPSRTIEGFASDSGKLSLIPAFVYFLKPGTKKMPSYNKLSPSGMFFSKSIDYPIDRGSQEFPGVPKREDWLGLRFYVKFSLSEQESGNYKFRIVCNDSAKLIIGKKLVVNAEGSGNKAVVDQTGVVALTAGSHEMFLDYLQTTGPNALQLFITPPGGEEKIFAFQ